MKNNLIHKHLERFLNLSKNSKSKNYSLLDDAFSNEDIIAGIDVLLSKKLQWEKLLIILKNNLLNILELNMR